MSQVKICRAHNLDKNECNALTEELLGQLVNKFGGSFSTQGDDYLYRHATGVKAQLSSTENDLTVDVKLGLMTRSLAPTLEQEINRVLDEHLS